MIRPPNICEACEHLDVHTVAWGRCTAFPMGIPDEIWFGGYDHRQPYEEDNGITFLLSQSPGAEELLQGYEGRKIT